MKEKGKRKIIIVILILIILICVIGLILLFLTSNNMIATKKAIVVRVYERYLYAYGFDNNLYSVSYSNDGDIGFKQGQEILIYFDGMMLTTYPEQISKVGKIKILKEKSDTQIPDNILRYCYSSINNVSVSVTEFTRSEISFTITDTNEIRYGYPNDYTIYKKVKNENYTGIGYKIGEDTENSTSGYTRNRT